MPLTVRSTEPFGGVTTPPAECASWPDRTARVGIAAWTIDGANAMALRP
jgi:hypothetical protein